METETIVAVSTAVGTGGVAIIRLSGNPLPIAEKMFKPIGKIKVQDFEPYKLYVGEIDAGSFTDYGMCVYFKAPKSYTGEDMIEFHSHGGIAITAGVLKRAVTLGARIATRGEYTKRAFINGKLSLSSAEGLVDMINSESEGEVKAGYSLYREKLKNQTDKMQDILTYVLAEIDANIDFPEEDLEEKSTVEIKEKLKALKVELTELIRTYDTGRKVKTGVAVGIVGKPNTGKSSILNALLNYDKAIVSNIAGTTRDIVEGSIDIKGVKFNFKDTAGLRDSEDTIEKIGIGLTKRVIEESDLVLAVFDSSEKLDKEDEKLLSDTAKLNRLVVYNKSDKSAISGTFDIAVSAKTGENIDKLKELIFSKTVNAADLSKDFIMEQRHYGALKRALEHLDRAIMSIGESPLDLASIDIRSAWETLGEISGKTASEEIINEIFSKFCVGK